MITNCRTITLEKAKQAVEAYNKGTYFYGCSNTNIDLRGRILFQGGLGTNYEQILGQLEFVGLDYGGVLAHRAAISLAPQIATDILANRDAYPKALMQTQPLRERLPDRYTIELLFGPFQQTLCAKGRTWKNWIVWGSKFWHFPNPDAFVIKDSRADEFFRVGSAGGSVERYLVLAERIRDFIDGHQSWIPELRQIDRENCCSENKLWDKVWYGIGELERHRARKRRGHTHRP